MIPKGPFHQLYYLGSSEAVGLSAHNSVNFGSNYNGRKLCAYGHF